VTFYYINGYYTLMVNGYIIP